jgi:hypothetical protein
VGGIAAETTRDAIYLCGMKQLRARTTIAAAVLFACATVAGAGELWDQAVGLYEEYGSLLPGRMTIRLDQYNGRGNLLSSETSEYELGVGPSGEIETRITSAFKDGEDVTEDRQNGSRSGSPFGGDNDGEDDSPFAGLQKSPFDPAEQESVSVTDTGRLEMVGGVRTRVHLFQQSTSGENRTTGTAWIAEATGVPVRLSAAIEPLPGFIDMFQMDQTFEVDTDGRWYMARMEFVGEGNILFVRRRVESEFEFSDYFLPPSQSLH